MNVTESDYPAIYKALNNAITQYADFVGVGDLERYFVPLRQQNNPGAFPTTSGILKPQHLEKHDMMEQFAHSLQNSGQMAHSVMFEKKMELEEKKNASAETSYRILPGALILTACSPCARRELADSRTTHSTCSSSMDIPSAAGLARKAPVKISRIPTNQRLT